MKEIQIGEKERDKRTEIERKGETGDGEKIER